MKTLLLFEDNTERIVAFESILPELNEEWQMRVWRDVPTMLAECVELWVGTHRVSRDHDLNPRPGATCDPGTGHDAGKLLASHFAFCPVIIHSTNAGRAWAMAHSCPLQTPCRSRWGVLHIILATTSNLS